MRISRSTRGRSEAGFTLIELLVVMIVIGILATIAVPVFLSQRARAHDVSTKSDVSTVGKEIATYYVEGGAGLALDLDVEPGRAIISDGNGYYASINLTNGTALPLAGPVANLAVADRWCVSLTDDAGAIKSYKYTATSGLGEGTCTP